MKVLLLAVCTLLLISAVSSIGFRAVLIRSCVKQTRIKSLDLALFYGTLYKQVSKSTKCYLECLFESTGFIIDGEVNKDLIEISKERQTMSPKGKLAFDMIDACKDVKVAGECEEGLALFRCFIDFGRKIPVDSEEK